MVSKLNDEDYGKLHDQIQSALDNIPWPGDFSLQDRIDITRAALTTKDREDRLKKVREMFDDTLLREMFDDTLKDAGGLEKAEKFLEARSSKGAKR